MDPEVAHHVRSRVLFSCSCCTHLHVRALPPPTHGNRFFGTWEVTLQFSHIVMPSGGPLYYEFKPDHTYRLFGINPQAPPNDRDIVETGTWYAGGDFIYLRLPWEQASYTALVPWHIDALSPNEVQVHVGSTRGVFKRVSLPLPSASNQSLQPTPRALASRRAGRRDVQI
jgi:hypothetical protein